MTRNTGRRLCVTAMTATLLALVVLLGGAATGAAAPASAATSGFLFFYEGNNATQGLVCTVPVPPGRVFTQVNFKSDPYGCTNDEARSVRFTNPNGAVTIEVWDDSGCLNDRSDRSIIDIAPGAQARVDSFQLNSPQERGLPFYQYYVRRSGSLDGKVSCIKIIRP